MTARAAPLASSAYSYDAFAWAFVRVVFVFLFVGPLIAFLIDGALISLAVLVSFLGHPNAASRGAELIADSPVGLLFWPIVFLIPQFISTLFASLSLLVIGRVSFWWMVATAPLVVYRAGFSFFAALLWDEVDARIGIESPGFLVLLAIDIVVVTICWWWVRNLRRRALWHSTAPIRSNSIE